LGIGRTSGTGQKKKGTQGQRGKVSKVNERGKDRVRIQGEEKKAHEQQLIIYDGTQIRNRAELWEKGEKKTGTERATDHLSTKKKRRKT